MSQKPNSIIQNEEGESSNDEDSAPVSKIEDELGFFDKTSLHQDQESDERVLPHPPSPQVIKRNILHTMSQNPISNIQNENEEGASSKNEDSAPVIRFSWCNKGRRRKKASNIDASKSPEPHEVELWLNFVTKVFSIRQNEYDDSQLPIKKKNKFRSDPSHKKNCLN